MHLSDMSLSHIFAGRVLPAEGCHVSEYDHPIYVETARVSTQQSMPNTI